MSEPRRSTRTRAREEAAPPPPPPEAKETPSKVAGAKSLKRKRTSIVTKESTPATPVNETSQLPLKQVLPIRVVDGQPLPTLPEPQPHHLPPQEYQDVQQRYADATF